MRQLILALVALYACAGVHANSCSALPPSRSATLRIAMVVHGPPLSDPNGAAIRLDVNPIMLPTPYFTNARDKSLFQAAQLYHENVERAGGIPLSDGTQMPVELVYFNLGPGAIASTTAAISLYTQRALNLSSQLANATGPYGRFAFVMTPAFSSNAKLAMQLAFMNACETSQTCVTIGAVSGEPDQYICPTPTPADCVSRGRLSGSRRFKYGFSNFVDPTQDFKGHVTGLRQNAVTSTALLFDSVGTTAAIYAATLRLAKQTGLKVLYKLNIPMAGTLSTLSLTADDVADALVQANPQSVLIMTSVGQASAVDIANVLKACKARNWWPQSINFGGGVDDSLLNGNLLVPDDLLYTSGMNPWSPLFQDSGYHAVNVPGVNYEMYSATDTEDSPAIFARAMDTRWGEHPDKVAGYVFAAAITGALHIAQKLVEQTLSDDATILSQAGSGLSAPSAWGLIQFDPYGRPVMREAALYQNRQGRRKTMVYPPNIAQPLIFPIPDFSERQFVPSYISNAMDKVVVSVTAVAMVYVATWMVFVGVFWHTTVVRASTPLFCMLILAGCQVLLASNYFTTTQSTDARCAAQWWLLTIGFSLTFAPLFIKTYRIYRIFDVKQLTVLRMPTSQLAMLLAAVIGVDLVLNAIWTGTGGTAVALLVPDEFRPANNTYVCHTGKSAPFLAAHVAIKGLMTIVGMLLSWKVRNVDPTFNEAFHCMLVIYNLAMVSMFVVPMVATSVGGAKTAMLVQASAVVFISTVTATIMFVPKYASLNQAPGASLQHANKTYMENADNNTNSARVLSNRVTATAGVVGSAHKGGSSRFGLRVSTHTHLPSSLVGTLEAGTPPTGSDGGTSFARKGQLYVQPMTAPAGGAQVEHAVVIATPSEDRMPGQVD
jgi:hypothetical protein